MDFSTIVLALLQSIPLEKTGCAMSKKKRIQIVHAWLFFHVSPSHNSSRKKIGSERIFAFHEIVDRILEAG